MKRLTVLLSCMAMIGYLFVGVAAAAGDEEIVNGILQARTAVKQLELPSAKMPDITVEKAYALQKSLTKAILAKGDAIGGFKAGLTSETGQRRFGVNDPVLAPLFKSGEMGPGAVVEQKDFVRLFLETEVGYVVAQKISEPVKDVAALKKMIKEVFPAVELPDLRFADMKNLKGPDIIADAVSSAKYIVGPKIPADKVDVTKVEVTLNHDGAVANQGKAADALGDQWKALLWLVNGVIAQGWTIEPGQILITGALGNMIPGKPGKYEGDWGPLGKLSWTVK
jgi:2-keto-4-pentenoate hydratase